MSLQFSYIDCKLDKDISLKAEPGLGLYVGNISPGWAPTHIEPTSTEYMKQFYAKTHNPSYTRLGNNTEPEHSIC